MNKQRLAILILAAVGVISVFLPWVSMPLIGSVNGAHGIGWLVFVLYAATIVVSLLCDRTQPLAGKMLYAAIAPSAVARLISLWKLVEFKSSMAGAMEDNPFAEALGASVSLGIGLILVVVAGFAVVAAGFLIKEKRAE